MIYFIWSHFFSIFLPSFFFLFFQIPGNCTQGFLNIGSAMPGTSDGHSSSISSSSSSSSSNNNINNSNNNHNGNNGVNINSNGNGMNNDNDNHMNTKIDANTRHDDNNNHYENPLMKLNIASSNHLSVLKVSYFTPVKITEIVENSYNIICFSFSSFYRQSIFHVFS